MSSKVITLVLEDGNLVNQQDEHIDVEILWTLEEAIKTCRDIRRGTGQKVILYAVDDMMTITFDV